MAIAEIRKKRTADFALRIITFCATPRTWEARQLSSQLFDAGTSVLKRADMAKGNDLDGLIDEAGQLVAIFTASQKTAVINLEKERLGRKKKRLASGSADRLSTPHSTIDNDQ